MVLNYGPRARYGWLLGARAAYLSGYLSVVVAGLILAGKEDKNVPPTQSGPYPRLPPLG